MARAGLSLLSLPLLAFAAAAGAPAAARAAAGAMPSYADGLISCPDGSTRPWPDKGVGAAPPSDAEMGVACNALDVKLTPAAGNAGDSDVDKAASEIIQLGRQPPSATHRLTPAERQRIADDQALAGKSGIIARLRTSWRLGQTNILAEEAGRGLAWLTLAVLAIFILTRRRRPRA